MHEIKFAYVPLYPLKLPWTIFIVHWLALTLISGSAAYFHSTELGVWARKKTVLCGRTLLGWGVEHRWRGLTTLLLKKIILITKGFNRGQRIRDITFLAGVFGVAAGAAIAVKVMARSRKRIICFFIMIHMFCDSGLLEVNRPAVSIWEVKRCWQWTPGLCLSNYTIASFILYRNLASAWNTGITISGFIGSRHDLGGSCGPRLRPQKVVFRNFCDGIRS